MSFMPPSGGMPPGMPGMPGMPGTGSDMPTSPPPQFTPQQTGVSAYAVDPGSMWGCLDHYTYVWLRNGEQFWFYPTFIGRRSVSGYRWNGRNWMYYGIDARQISSFTCY